MKNRSPGIIGCARTERILTLLPGSSVSLRLAIVPASFQLAALTGKLPTRRVGGTKQAGGLLYYKAVVVPGYARPDGKCARLLAKRAPSVDVVTE